MLRSGAALWKSLNSFARANAPFSLDLTSFTRSTTRQRMLADVLETSSSFPYHQSSSVIRHLLVPCTRDKDRLRMLCQWTVASILDRNFGMLGLADSFSLLGICYVSSNDTRWASHKISLQLVEINKRKYSRSNTLLLHPCSGAPGPLPGGSHICAPSNEALLIPGLLCLLPSFKPSSRVLPPKMFSVVSRATCFSTDPDDSSRCIRLS